MLSNGICFANSSYIKVPGAPLYGNNYLLQRAVGPYVSSNY